jgi:hypothetical protein
MSAWYRRGNVVAVLAVAWLMLYQPGKVQAHPQFVGRWTATVPPGGIIIYDFAPCDYLGNGVWRGPYTLSMSNGVIATGVYELRMWSETVGTLGMRENIGVTTSVAIVDLGERLMTYMNAAFRPSLAPHP